MSDISEHYLTTRFDADPRLFDYETEGAENGVEVTYASKRFGLLKEDVSNGMNPISAERIMELVAAFKKKSLAADDQAITKLKVASRTILYNQLAEAYAFGLTCFASIYNATFLREVLLEHDLNVHGYNLLHKGRYNKWNAITALLYGEWESVSENAEDGLAYKRDRSAEKYGCVLALLEIDKVRVADVPQYIAEYEYVVKSSGKTLKGIIALETRYRAHSQKNKPTPQTKTPRQINARNKLIERGENADLCDDVFDVAKPEKLPSAVQYGRAVFKIAGDRMLIVGYDAWEASDYERHAIGRANKAIAEEKKIAAAIPAQDEEDQ
ncbi:hypothetical protein [Novosphingobium clariflavum]|uniref:Uncharacterized protein n=1 Tax=Novosphingobium clariflavum TaxID=2029884 RepID=A0ABV6S2F2_9SPHN|nr:MULTISPECIES: hypothetical protein [Novosphingobium]